MAKYTKEEKQKAIDLYIRYSKLATKVIQELGYPNERHTLVSWYRGYEEKGEVKDDGREEKRLSHVYSEEQVYAAPDPCKKRDALLTTRHAKDSLTG